MHWLYERVVLAPALRRPPTLTIVIAIAVQASMVTQVGERLGNRVGAGAEKPADGELGTLRLLTGDLSKFILTVRHGLRS